MDNKLPPEQAELVQRCDELLHYLWDPIGVAGSPGARDEYASYLPDLVDLLSNGSAQTPIEAYLLQTSQGE